jgi:hypothetical protein
MHFALRRLWFASSLFACGAQTIPSSNAPFLPTVDIVEPVRGVPDGDDDPAVVLVASQAPLACTGVLLAPDVVLTAWHCVGVSGSASAPPSSCTSLPVLPPPSSLRVLVGADGASAVERARARAIVAPGAGADPCSADLALLVLDQTIDDIEPVPVDPTGAAQGDHLRTIEFQPAGQGAVATRFRRDHIPVVGTTSTGLQVYEAACAGGCGGPALDESSGEVVGIASRWIPPEPGGAGFDAYVAVEPFLALVGEAMAASTAAAGSAPSASVQKATKGPADMGAPCDNGSDCAAGACVTDGDQRYCTRRCSPYDACPTHFKCEETSERQTVCIQG